jgi:hypothetical protein
VRFAQPWRGGASLITDLVVVLFTIVLLKYNLMIKKKRALLIYDAITVHNQVYAEMDIFVADLNQDNLLHSKLI